MGVRRFPCDEISCPYFLTLLPLSVLDVQLLVYPGDLLLSRGQLDPLRVLLGLALLHRVGQDLLLLLKALQTEEEEVYAMHERLSSSTAQA